MDERCTICEGRLETPGGKYGDGVCCVCDEMLLEDALNRLEREHQAREAAAAARQGQ